MLAFVLILGCALAFSQTDDFLKVRAQGFLPLMNGLDLDGWKNDGKGSWKAEDSTLVSEGDGATIETTHDSFRRYVLRLEWKASTKNECAVLLRGESFPTGAVSVGDYPDGSGGITSLNLRPAKKADKPLGEWNRMEITVNGPAVQVILNDQIVINKASFTDMPERGSIAFHSSTPSFSIRAVRMRPLGLDLPYFMERVQPVFKLQCVGCHTGESTAGQHLPLQVPDHGVYDDTQVMSDYLEAAKRVTPGDPDGSLLLRKASGKVAHGGGRQIAVNGPEYKAFAAWIKGEVLKK